MYGNAAGVELQPLNIDESSSSLEAARREAWRRHSLLEPKFQRRFWITVAVAIVIGAGVIFAATSATSTRQHGHSTTEAPIGSSLQGSSARGRFPAEPYLAPSNSCPLDTQALGPEQQLAIPINYHLLLSLSDAAFYQPGDPTGRVAAGFGGSVNITLHVQQDAACVSLHARNLSFSSISARLIGASWLQPPQQQQQQQAGADVCLCGLASACLVQECGRLFKPRPGSDAYIMSLGPYLAPAGSNLSLQFTYSAVFGGKLPVGLFRTAPYPSPSRDGQEVVALATQFETIFARTMLPCLDEPNYKATFVVEIEAPSDLTVLSNSPAASTRWILNNASSSVSHSTFQPSPLMSTYLLSVAVGEFKAVTARTSSGQAVSVWTTPNTIAAAATPLRLAVAALEHYQRYTGISQSRGPDTKWDLLAVPGKTGAVENWGLLTMDPERFLFSSGGAWDLFRCANVICHEVAHQWFGNLVTAATWADLLVNEGLATLLEYGCLAAVLPQQVGPLGAAVLMRGMFGGPAGVNPGVHEGPYEKTLSYDASPLAQPLLGAAGVDFGVPVYSKAAALVASIGSYAAAAAGTQQHSAAGPLESLVGSQPPSALQEVLRQHLQQHAFSTATAQDTLTRILQLAPGEVSGNALQVITGWRAPGSPLIQLSTTPQGLKLQQRRFCSWGLLDDSFLAKLLVAASTPGQVLPTPPATNSSQGNSGALLCPTSLDGQDRAVPWTPVYLALLADRANSTSSSVSSNNTLKSQLSCGQWVVLMRDEQTAALPVGCEAAAAGLQAGGSGGSGPGFILEGDGGWGVYRTLYPAPQRAALRQWVTDRVQQAAREVASSGGHTSAAAASSLELSVLLAASKILQDQAALALSAFHKVPGAELWAVVEAAVNATVAAGASLQNGTAGVAGFGTVLYTLLAPLLPAVEVLGDRAGSRACWMQQQERLAAALAPVAATALSAFASNPAPADANASSPMSYTSPDQLLGAMSLNRLLTAAALVDAGTAEKLCTRFNQAAAAAGNATAAADAVLSRIHPDLQHAVLDVAAAQPPGCQLDWSGMQLFSTLQQWYLDGREPRAATMAAFALAHLPARGFHAPVPWQQVLALLMGLNSSQPAAGTAAPLQGPPAHTAASPASGISPAKHAAELAVLLSRAVTASRRFPQPEIAPAPQDSSSTAAQPSSSSGGSSSTPVLSELIRQWPLIVGGSVGEATAWEALREVAAREVQEPQQWQQLAAWAVQQLPAGSGGEPASVVQLRRKRVQAVLGAAWSTVSWVQANTAAVCQQD